MEYKTSIELCLNVYRTEILVIVDYDIDDDKIIPYHVRLQDPVADGDMQKRVDHINETFDLEHFEHPIKTELLELKQQSAFDRYQEDM